MTPSSHATLHAALTDHARERLVRSLVEAGTPPMTAHELAQAATFTMAVDAVSINDVLVEHSGIRANFRAPETITTLVQHVVDAQQPDPYDAVAAGKELAAKQTQARAQNALAFR